MPIALLTPLITAALQALAETMRFLSTEQGQAVVSRALADQAEARALFGQAKAWLLRLGAGEFLKFDGNRVFLRGEKGKASN